MKTPLGWHNLIHDRLRTIVALAGVAFAVTLIFLQLGFYGSVLQTATLIYSQLEFDILLRSPDYLHFSRSGTIPRSRLYQVQGLPQVQSAAALDIGYIPYRNPHTQDRRAILVMGFDPDGQVFRLAEINAAQHLLQEPGRVLIDRRSRPEFGPQALGTQTDVGRQRITVSGQFTLGTGFGADGALVMSAATLRRFFPTRPASQCSLGLVRLAPGADPRDVACQIKQQLPADVQVLTRAEVERAEQQHWTSKTSVGIILGTGVVVAVLVGIAIVYQVLSSNISAHLGEYATLKAMGYPSRTLSWVVVQQALILAAIGFLPGLLIAMELYDLTRRLAHIPISMTWLRAAGVFGGSILMCSLAAIASLNKVYSADPAELF